MLHDKTCRGCGKPFGIHTRSAQVRTAHRQPDGLHKTVIFSSFARFFGFFNQNQRKIWKFERGISPYPFRSDGYHRFSSGDWGSLSAL
jgi:hypothetical protein